MTKIAYNPQIAYKLLGDPPYWCKKLDDEFPEEFLFKEPDYSNTDNFGFVFKKVFHLSVINHKRIQKHKKGFNVFFEYDNLLEALEAHAFINYFALKNKIHPMEILRIMIFFELQFIYMLHNIFKKDIFKDIHHLAIRKIKKFEYLGDIKLNELEYSEDILKNLTSIDLRKLSKNKYLKKRHGKLFKIALYNFENIIKTYNHLATDPKSYHLSLINVYYQYTLDKVLRDIQANKINAKHINLSTLNSLRNIDIEVIKNEVKFHQIIFEEKLSKKQTLTYALKDPNHYLNSLFNDKLDIEVDKRRKDVKIFLKNIYKGYLIGFYEKGLLLSANKREIITELQRMQMYIKKLQKNEEIIQELDTLIEFFKQDKRYEKYIPYKAIAKYTGMSKQQIKSLINAISNFQSYSKTYQNIESKIKLFPLQTP
ncbi:hypothetical protein NitYY0826_C1532 [Nitratiruptor sp. YY08-26]|uniref:hypothetical protein n=1 Tax=unclassified Nitratiruptor TaxID=2624044 RepID=UPI0019163E24|nr:MULTISPECIES: hypothetical protein [unclassified Nitratiruptor]BCD62650.1 hypothetical protein NitYY0813_C1530 [Nitratiruptor sp. YY08-13]BCD66586.1 hypothetical protein NitYY0826_C1532 [Nitratiruptor sp. YY08-26]